MNGATAGSLPMPVDAPEPSQARRVLVLEDDEHAGTVITEYLRARGHAVDLLPNGTDALWFVTKNQPDVVVVDIFMPGSDGLQTVRDIRARAPEIVIIAISGRFQHGDYFLRCARHLGATHVLPKPVDVVQLAALAAGQAHWV